MKFHFEVAAAAAFHDFSLNGGAKKSIQGRRDDDRLVAIVLWFWDAQRVTRHGRWEDVKKGEYKKNINISTYKVGNRDKERIHHCVSSRCSFHRAIRTSIINKQTWDNASIYTNSKQKSQIRRSEDPNGPSKWMNLVYGSQKKFGWAVSPLATSGCNLTSS